MGALDEPKAYIIGIIIFTMFILGGMTMINSATEKNPDLFDTNDTVEINRFNNSFNKLSQLEDSMGSLEDSTKVDAKELKFLDLLSGFVTTAWNAVNGLLTTFSFMNDIFNYGLTEWLMLPAWVGSLIKMMVTIIIIFAAYGAIFKV